MEATKTADKEICIEFPKETDNSLTVLLSLQTLFITGNEGGYEAWRYAISNNHVLCISTNSKGLFELTAKGRNITFYDEKENYKKVDLSGNNIPDVLKKFLNVMLNFNYCTIIVVENESGNSNQKKFNFKLKHKDNKIVRLSYGFVKYSSEGINGDL